MDEYIRMTPGESLFERLEEKLSQCGAAIERVSG